jgi:hypothetical protein
MDLLVVLEGASPQEEEEHRESPSSKEATRLPTAYKYDILSTFNFTVQQLNSNSPG